MFLNCRESLILISLLLRPPRYIKEKFGTEIPSVYTVFRLLHVVMNVHEVTAVEFRQRIATPAIRVILIRFLRQIKRFKSACEINHKTISVA